MWEIVAAIMAALVGTLLLWFIMPMLNLARLMTEDIVIKNPVYQNNTVLQQTVKMGDMFFLSMGFIVFMVIAFLLISKSTKRGPDDF